MYHQLIYEYLANLKQYGYLRRYNLQKKSD